MPLAPGLARWLSANGHDAVHAAALGLSRAADTEIIARALRDARTIITADLDYPRLLALAAAMEPSVILFRGGDWREDDLALRVGELLATLKEDDLQRNIFVVERDRIRRRPLPIR